MIKGEVIFRAIRENLTTGSASAVEGQTKSSFHGSDDAKLIKQFT